VTDYTARRKVYDELDQARLEMDAAGHAVYEAIGDPNDVTAWHDFSTNDAADSFASSPRLREAIRQAGVQGKTSGRRGDA
jgi:hypothetical protein